MGEACTLVVPCFNEERRLDPARLDRLAEAAGARVLLVDDGSTDGTRALLQRLATSAPDRFGVLGLDANRGKGEAVRRGLLAALDQGAGVVGYCEADFATPPEEVARLVAALRDDPTVDAVLGSRVALLGADIRRSAARHYSGRLFATASSLVLRTPIYDTQCGAKVFRASDGLRDALREPFVSRWAFDVELLGRLLRLPGHRMVEVPLRAWSEAPGSKLTLRARVRAAVDLLAIHRALRRAGRHLEGQPVPSPSSPSTGSTNSATGAQGPSA